jgi:hypothetical protein
MVLVDLLMHCWRGDWYWRPVDELSARGMVLVDVLMNCQERGMVLVDLLMNCQREEWY